MMDGPCTRAGEEEACGGSTSDVLIETNPIPVSHKQATSQNTVSAAFFGCVDLKYGPDGAVRVLELGDGHTSGFTGAGAFIPRKFAASYTKKSLGPIPDTIVENKALTHYAFVDSHLENLRPAAGIFPFQYDTALAVRVLHSVGGGSCVLKLIDRQRGCGVVAVEPTDLDHVLQVLLGEQEDKFEQFHSALDAVSSSGGQTRTFDWEQAAWTASGSCGFPEQITHWLADECPCFLAEARCESKPVTGEDGRYYDGTLRVGFALLDDSVTCLGAYWKLPDVPIDETDAELSTRVVSHTHGGSGTASCSAQDLKAVWAVLEGTLPRIFDWGTDAVTIPHLMLRYQDDPLLLMVALLRIAGGYAERNPEESKRILSLAEKMRPTSSDRMQTRVRSYMLRSKGTCLARSAISSGGPRWSMAEALYDDALAQMPESSAAAYLAGMARFSRRAYTRAAAHFARSLVADCDFAPAYSQLAICCLLLNAPDACIGISEAMLVRHTRIAAGYHHIAAALYAKEAAEGGCNLDRRLRAVEALSRAKELQRSKSWCAEDDVMLAVLQSEATLPPVPVRTWIFHAWRL